MDFIKHQITIKQASLFDDSMNMQAHGDKVLSVSDYTVSPSQIESRVVVGIQAVQFFSAALIDLESALAGGYKGFLERAAEKTKKPPPTVNVKIDNIDEAKRVSGFVNTKQGIVSLYLFGVRSGATLITFQILDFDRKLSEDDFFRLIHSFGPNN